MGAIVILAIILGVIGAMSGGDKTTTEKKQESYLVDVEGVGKIKGAFSSNVGIAISGVREATVLGNEMFKEKSQGKFIVIDVIVSNQQKDAITIDSSSFKLKDDQDREFSASTKAQTALLLSSGKDDAFLNEINPGIITSATIVFDVPSGVKGLNLKARGGMTGKEVTLPLEVQKAQ